jgi:hypothetical protein
VPITGRIARFEFRETRAHRWDDADARKPILEADDRRHKRLPAAVDLDVLAGNHVRS